MFDFVRNRRARTIDLTAASTSQLVEELMTRNDYLPRLIIEKREAEQQVKQLAPLATEVVRQRAEYRDVRAAFDTLFSNAVEDLRRPI